MLKTLRKPIRIGPEDHGRRMSLDHFDRATGQEGHLYELNKGVIDVVDVPQPDHGRQVEALREQFVRYKVAHRGVIDSIGGSGEAKIPLSTDQSERHPDLSVYLSAQPQVKDVWAVWVPEIVIEVVSPRSVKRDYEDKPAEYLEFGVREYWIVDSTKQQMTAMVRRAGRWDTQLVKPPQKYSTYLLPGFTLNLKRVLTAAK
jgi:Uma2 family endonuclease